MEKLLPLLLLLIPFFLSAQSETESNNTFNNANAISFDQAVIGAISVNGDLDYFRVEITQPGVIIARLKNIPANRFYGVTIFNTNREEITNDFGSSTDPAYADRLLCTPGTYYVLVNESGNNDSSPDSYELTVSFDVSDVNECNNSFDSATPIQLGETVRASIFDVGDRDYYQINVPEAGVLVARLLNIPASRFYVVSLYNENQQLVENASGTATDPVTLAELRCSPGVNYIVINESGNNASSPLQYELTLSFDNTDVYECNNTFDDAAPIQFEQPINASIYDNGDNDYYQVEVPNSGYLYASLTNIPDGRTYIVSIYNSNQERISSESGTDTNPATTGSLRCSGGTHYIVINESGNNSSSPDQYVLTVFFNDEDAYECNNNLADATPINPCNPVTGSILPNNDKDYYRINITEAGDYSVTVRDVPSNIAIDIEVINEFGDRVAINSGAPVSASANLNFSIATPGLYFVIINGSSSSTSSFDLYTMTFSSDIPCSPVPEICNNGQDDDGDGLTDCEDPDCSEFGACSDASVDCADADINFGVQNSPETCAGNNGSLSITNPTGGQAPYSYEWSNGSTNAGINGLAAGQYSVTVADANGCTATQTFTVNTNCSENNCPQASFTTNDQGGGTIFFENTSTNNPLAVFWDFGDGGQSIDFSPTHSYTASGTYEITLIVANDCSIEEQREDTLRQNITVNLETSSDPRIVIGEEEGADGEEVLVPVVAENFNTTLASFQGVFSLQDPNVGQILDVEGGLIGDATSLLFNPSTGGLSFFSVNNPAVLGARDTLFYLRILLQGENGDMSAVLLGGDNSLPLEIFDTDINEIIPEIVEGKVTIKSTFMVQGAIRTHWDAPVANATVTIGLTPPLDGQSSLEFTTDNNGQFMFPEIPAETNCVITPEKDINPNNGLSAIGLFAAQRFILTLPIPQISSPFQVMAGDANCNGQLTTFDLYLIQKVQVGIETEFSDCPSWVFVPTEESPNFQLASVYYPNYPFPNSTSVDNLREDFSTEFIGVKVGDILNRADPSKRNIRLLPGKNDEAVPVLVQTFHKPEQQEVHYQLSTGSALSPVSYQLSLGFDPELLQFRTAYTSDDAPAIGAQNGRLHLSWFSNSGEAKSFKTGAEVITLVFKTKGTAESWRQKLWLANDGLTPVLHDQNLQPHAIKLNTPTTTSLDPVAADEQVRLYQNQPNPFSQRTQIGFYLPQATNAQLIVQDAFGRVIWQKEAEYAYGEHQEFIELDLTSGMYFYSLRTPQKLLTKSMIVK